MENAADALKMAGFLLIFIVALSISINAFGEARKTATAILDYSDREYNYTYVEEGSTERTVGVETIIPSIYKAYKENYKIIFETSLFNDGLYKKRNAEGIMVPVYEIDLEKEVLGNDTQKEQFITSILYGADNDTKDAFMRNLGISLNDNGIYDKIKGKEFKESLGIYYQDSDGTENEDVPLTNKLVKRVITYSDI